MDIRWTRVQEIFHQAVELPLDQRDSFLNEACGGDAELRNEVETLIAASEDADAFLVGTLRDAAVDFLDRQSPNVREGEKIGHYTVTGLLGCGGMGEVHSAWDVRLGRAVALKFLSPHVIGLRSAVERLIHEAKAASALNHPHIVTVHEVIQSKTHLAIVMERVDGHSLRALGSTPFPIHEVLRSAQQIARALEAAHAHGIVHRDIKPENIMLRRDGYIKILDFGLAHSIAAGENPTASPWMGTLSYMSPEQSRGESLTGATDVFSLGIVLYELCAGVHPFQRDSAVEVVHAIATVEPQPLSALNPLVPRKLEALIGAMLEKNPAERPDAETLARALAEIDLRASVPNRPRADRISWWRVAATVVVFAAIAAFAVWSRRQGTPVIKEPAIRELTSNDTENRVTAAALSPDAKLLAYSDLEGVNLRTLQTGHTGQLRAPRDFRVDRLSWLGDGSRLLMSGFRAASRTPSLWILSTAGKPPQLLRENVKEASASPGGTIIAFTNSGGSEIWTMKPDGENPKLVKRKAGRDSFSSLVWSPNSRFLSYEKVHYAPKLEIDFDHRAQLEKNYNHSFETIDAATGRIVSVAPDVRMSSACGLADGRILFLRWDPPVAIYSYNVWEVRTDPATGRLIEAPHQITHLTGTELLGISATPNGDRITVVRRQSQADVYVATLQHPGPHLADVRRLTFDMKDDYPHAWTPDSKAVIFESDRNGPFQLFKEFIDQHTAETLVATSTHAVLPQISPDGKWLLYLSIKPGAYALVNESVRTLERVPMDGGSPQPVPAGGSVDEFSCAFPGGKRCVLRKTEGRQYVYYDLDPIRGKGRELARTPWSRGILGDWCVSPDGTEVAIPNHESDKARIHIVSLEGAPDREVIGLGFVNMRGLSWAADAKGWFVSIQTSVGVELLYVDLGGKPTVLLETAVSTWGVAAPDGMHLAFVGRPVVSNAIEFERAS